MWQKSWQEIPHTMIILYYDAHQILLWTILIVQPAGNDMQSAIGLVLRIGNDAIPWQLN
jgi:hypothetical protein